MAHQLEKAMADVDTICWWVSTEHLIARENGELELDFENPTANSNRDFEECTVKVTVKIIAKFIINSIAPKI